MQGLASRVTDLRRIAQAVPRMQRWWLGAAALTAALLLALFVQTVQQSVARGEALRQAQRQGLPAPAAQSAQATAARAAPEGSLAAAQPDSRP